MDEDYAIRAIRKIQGHYRNCNVDDCYICHTGIHLFNMIDDLSKLEGV
jgi:hypothetical protein